MDAKISILVTSTALFIMAAMIGYLYWQQTKMLQHIQALSMAISAQFVHAHEHEHPPLPESDSEPEPEPETQPEEDDRVSVEYVQGPPVTAPAPEPVQAEVDVDDLQSKTVVQLKELLTAKGIPFGKRDSKSSLVELLKASS